MGAASRGSFQRRVRESDVEEAGSNEKGTQA
jgi:hypothetical protein